MNILMMIIFAIIGSVLTLGISYFIWLGTRPKKIVWIADVYTKSDGVSSVKDNEGNEVYSINDLKPFTRDFLEKTTIGYKEIYRLQKLNKTTPAVQNECVEIWGREKRVSVLLDNDSCTILKKGFDSERGKQIFNPIPYDTQNLITNQITIKKAQLRQEKNIWQAIVPYIAIIGGLMLIFFLAYSTLSFYLDLGKQVDENIIAREQFSKEIAIIQREGLITFADRNVEAAKEYRATINELNKEINELKLVLQENIEKNK